MYEDVCQNISDSLLYAFSTLIEQQTKLASDSLNAITGLLQESLCSIAACYEQNAATTLSNQISALVATLTPVIEIPTIELPSILLPTINFLKEINLQEESIELTEEDCDSINSLLESSCTANDVPLKTSHGEMAMADFIKDVLIPILAIVLPMFLTIYYHKIDSIESQKQYIEELQLKEKELQLKEEELRIKEQQLHNDMKEKEALENILTELQNQSEYLDSLLLDSECQCTTLELPDEAQEPFCGVPEFPVETPDCSDVTVDESDNQ